MYIELLKKVLLDSIYGSHVLGKGVSAPSYAVENGTYWPQRAHTMIGMKRLTNIQECFETVVREKIPGDLIETGVWRGGATILMKGLVKYHNEPRKVFVADSFEGLPKPDPKYSADSGDIHHTLNFLAVDVETVKNNFRAYDLLDDDVVFVKGFFETSLKDAPIDKLCILRLDGDMYSSTIQVLDQLYSKVSPGGFVIVDDWTLTGCRKAIIDFRATHGITAPMVAIDDSSAYWRV
jgi:O-methyltransferase